MSDETVKPSAGLTRVRGGNEREGSDAAWSKDENKRPSEDKEEKDGPKSER